MTYAATNDWANAAIMTAGIALAAVGAGAAVVAVKAVKTGVKVGTAIAKAAPKAERAFNAVKTVASKVKPVVNQVKSAAKTVLSKISTKNQGNWVRWGPTVPGSPFRVSLGPAHKYWKDLGPVRRTLGSFHLHLERNVGVFSNNWLGKSHRVVLWGQ